MKSFPRTALAFLFLLTAASNACDDDPGRAADPEGVLAFDAAGFELPEALSYRDGVAYVSLAPKGQIVKVVIATGARSLYAQLPVPASSFTLGSTFDAEGNLYVGVGATNPDDRAGVAAAGIYRIPFGAETGGAPTLFASSATGLKFGNGLAFGADGSLYVTDAVEGAVYKIPAAGAVGSAALWKKDDALKGDQAACPGNVASFPIGANGVVAEADAVWVGNGDRGTLLRIAVEANGSAGALSTMASDCATLEGLDGLRPDPRAPGTGFIGTVNPKNSLVAIARTGEVKVIHSSSSLVGPADLVALNGTSPLEVLVVNSSFSEAFAPADAGLAAKPGLVKVRVP